MIELPDYTKEELDEMSQDFKEGVYDFKTIGFENKPSVKSGNMMTVLILTFDGPGFQFNQWEYFMHHMINDPGHVMHKATISRIKHYLESVGIEYTKDAFTESSVMGKEGQAHVWSHKKKGEDESRRCIKHFIKNGADVELPEDKPMLETPAGPKQIGPTKVEQKDTPTFDDDIPF